MVCFPFVIFVKIGITGVGVLKRAKGIDEDMPGFPIPIAFAPIPFVYQVEQGLHDLCDPIRFSFYRGSGHTETFFLPAVFPALAVISFAWGAYFAAIDWYFGTRLLDAAIGVVRWVLFLN